MNKLKTILTVVLSLIVITLEAQGLTDQEKEYLESTADSAYDLLKYDLPDETLWKELTYFHEYLGWEDWEIRRYAFTKHHIEGRGKAKIISDDGKDWGGLGMHKKNGMYDEFWRITNKEPWFAIEELAMPKSTNPDTIYLLTRIMPLRILNTVAMHHKWGFGQSKWVAMEIIRRKWNGGPNGDTSKRHLTEHDWQKFEYSYEHCIGERERNGRAQASNPIPGQVLRPSNWSD